MISVITGKSYRIKPIIILNTWLRSVFDVAARLRDLGWVASYLSLMLIAAFGFVLWIQGLSVKMYFATQNPVSGASLVPAAHRVCHHAATRVKDEMSDCSETRAKMPSRTAAP
jgi:hypothetical protein